jgi:hypothetical protein
MQMSLTEVDPAGRTAYQTMGTSQLLSVPYALYAKNVQNYNDTDASPTNEIQTLSISGTNLSLSPGGGTGAIPGDKWGTQVVVTDATLTGNGTATSTLGIAVNGVTSAKIADGTIANADMGSNIVNSANITDGTVVSADLADTR